jgi:hypothetical protein
LGIPYDIIIAGVTSTSAVFFLRGFVMGKKLSALEFAKFKNDSNSLVSQDDLQDLKNNYYKAVEGLSALQNSLKWLAKKDPVFLSELKLASKAIEEMDESLLGRFL